MDALVPSAPCQDGEEAFRGVGGIIHNAEGGSGGYRDPNNLLSCPHNPLSGLVV